MLNLQPYQNPTYFGYLAVALLPIMIGILYGRRFRWYETLVTLAFLVLTFGGDKWWQGLMLICYIIYEMILTFGYFNYRKKKNSGVIFVLAVILSILPLVIVKITPAIDAGKESIIGFLGISYLTFKTVGMIMETRDGIIKELGLWETLHFLLFFPTISSGPIDRFRRFKKDYDAVPERDKYLSLLEKGVHYIFLGFLYKFLLAYFWGSYLLPIVKIHALSHGTKMIRSYAIYSRNL